MMASNLYPRQAKKFYAIGKNLVGTVVLTVLWALLSLFAFPCTGAEAAVPSLEEIPGIYHSKDGDLRIWLAGNGFNFEGKMCTYDPTTGTAVSEEFTTEAGVSAGHFVVHFTKDAAGTISLHGQHYFPGYTAPKGYEEFSVAPFTIPFSGVKEANPETANQNNEETSEQKTSAEKPGNQENGESGQLQGYYPGSAGNGDSGAKWSIFPDFDEGEHDDLPDSDAGKVAAAGATAIGGGLLGIAGGAIGGGVGGGAGGAAGAVGSVGSGYGGFSPDGSGYGLEEGDYGSYEYETATPTYPDNMAIADDGSIRVTAPTGEELVYTRNEDGSYNIPTHTESGEALTYQDEDGNWHTAEPGTLSREEVMEGAKWYKEHEGEIIADRDEEDARQQAERDRLAKENAAWLEKERAVNSQLSQTSIELQKELKEMKQQQAKQDYLDKLHWKYDPVGKDLSNEELAKAIKKEQIKNNIEGGYHEQEAAKWDDRLVTAQEVKFAADQAVNAYGMLSGNQAFANAYSAATNYSETMMDAVVNHKDKGKALLKATIDTGLDMTANKFESKGWHITGNAFAGAYKQVNDNVYNGRDAWEGTDRAAVYGGAMGAVSKGLGKLKEMSEGTALNKNIGGSKPDLDVNTHSPKPDMDVETSGVRKTTIAERRAGEGLYKTKTPMSDADVKMSINEDVQAIRSMNDVRQLNKISTKMDAMEKANPRTYQADPEYQKLSQQFETQRAKVSEDMVAVDRMNALKGDTGTNLRQRYNQSAMEYENKVLQYRNESIAESTGLKPDQIGDFHASSNKDAIRAAGGPAAHDLDTSPNVKVESGTGNHKSVDFSQTDGDHHLVRGIYKAEHGRYPQTAAEYAEGQRLAQDRHFTNVSTRPSDTHEITHNPEAYVGSGKGDVNKVLQPQKYGTPDKGTGVLNEQTAIHKQNAPLEQHRQQYAEAQELRQRLNTDKTLSAAEKTEMGQKISALEQKAASNHYESTRTTGKEANVIGGINDVNIKNGLGDGMSADAKYIGDLANKVRAGEMDNSTYKQIVTEKYGSEENAQKILAKAFVTTNK